MICVANCVPLEKKRYLIENFENRVMTNLFFVYVIMLDPKNIIQNPSELLNQYEIVYASL